MKLTLSYINMLWLATLSANLFETFRNEYWTQYRTVCFTDMPIVEYHPLGQWLELELIKLQS